MVSSSTNRRILEVFYCQSPQVPEYFLVWSVKAKSGALATKVAKVKAALRVKLWFHFHVFQEEYFFHRPFHFYLRYLFLSLDLLLGLVSGKSELRLWGVLQSDLWTLFAIVFWIVRPQMVFHGL